MTSKFKGKGKIIKKVGTITFILISIGTFSWYSFLNPEGYKNLFYEIVNSKYEILDEESLSIGEEKKFLNEHIELSLNKRNNGKLLLTLDFRKIQIENKKISISVNDPVNFSIPFYPVDLQYTVQIEKENEQDKFLLKVFLNEEYVNSALEKNTPFIKPLFIKETQFFSYLFNLIINFVISLTAGLAAPLFSSNSKQNSNGTVTNPS